MIIVEGCDGSGKTTLVGQICKEFGFKQGQRGTKDRDKLYEVTRKDTHHALALAVEADKDPVVWDRLFYSDFVYAPVQGRPIAFQDPEASIIQAVIENLAPPVILCMPPVSVCEANAAKEHQMEGVEGNVSKIHKRYFEMFAHGEFIGMGRTGVIWYDYTGEAERPETGAGANPLSWTSELHVVFQHIHEYLERRNEEWSVYDA